jgi:hypothetical protein
MKIARTRSAPRAETHSAAVTLLSMPPDRPSTAPAPPEPPPDLIADGVRDLARDRSRVDAQDVGRDRLDLGWAEGGEVVEPGGEPVGHPVELGEGEPAPSRDQRALAGEAAGAVGQETFDAHGGAQAAFATARLPVT